MRLLRMIAVAALGFVTPSLLLAATPTTASKPTVTIAPAVVKDANQVAGFPYTAEVVGKAVFTRAGASTTSYRCGQLNSPDKVTVLEEDRNEWARVVPPAGSFSWICKQNVTIDPTSPDTATVSVQPTRVWTGSVYYDPMSSNELQLKLNVGDKVKLLNEEVGDYYKIVPPSGASLWISTQYIKKSGATTTVAGTSPGVPTAVDNPKEKEKLAEYRKLAAQLDAERAKPLAEQNYAQLRTAFEEMTKDPDAGKAVKYAAIQLERLERFELAARSVTDLKQQEQALTEARAKIDAETQAKMAQVPDAGKYAVIGILRRSLAYGDSAGAPRRYLIIGENGKILCYAQATGGAENRDLSQFYDKKVGLVGTISRDPASSLGLVQFSDVEMAK
jgi:uncharacterized protein YgiM (DUF1202 family)